jgi:hypothetical protein
VWIRKFFEDKEKEVIDSLLEKTVAAIDLQDLE